MEARIDLRVDSSTAAHVTEALRLQKEFGYDHACRYLDEAGVAKSLSEELLARRFERRRVADAPRSTFGYFPKNLLRPEALNEEGDLR